jgi:hypothetical protein
MDRNKRFAELAGIHRHSDVGFVEFREPPIGFKHICHSCGEIVPFINYNSDYTADPCEVLKVMMTREDWPEFQDRVGGADFRDGELRILIDIDLILDTTGKLLDIGIDWLWRLFSEWLAEYLFSEWLTEHQPELHFDIDAFFAYPGHGELLKEWMEGRK